MLAVVLNGRLFVEAQLLTSLIPSVINLQVSDEWDRLPGNISDEGFFVVVFAFFPSYFLLHTVRKILRKIQLKS